jgi:Lrp/AsnC family transcriptional regulator, regulator for asnA, asnC and gidA
VLDITDQRIIDVLQQDGRISNSEIARRIGVTESTVRRRIERFERDGTIFVAAFLNPLHFGYTGLAIIGLAVDPNRLEAVADEISTFDEVRYVALALGRYDLLVEAALPDPIALRTFLTRRIGPIAGIREVEPHIVPEVRKFADRYWKPDDWSTFEAVPEGDAFAESRG